jgi:hypothetical protein
MITIVNTPSGKPSVQDDLWHIVSSDNSTDTDFKYVFDIFIGGVQKVRLKQFPDPSTGKGYLNASQVVRNSITYDWAVMKDDVLCAYPNSSGEISIAYDVRYGEEASGVTDLNLASGTTRAYNWRAPIFKRRIKTINDYNNTWVTSRGLTANCAYPDISGSTYLGEKLMAGFNRTSSLTLVVNVFNFNGSSTTTNLGAIAASPSDYFQLNIAPAAINNYAGSALITSNCKYYEVYLNGADDIFRVDMICDRGYTPVPLHFMNAWGLFDTARFGLVSRLTADAERKSYTQRDYELGATSVDYFDSNEKYRESKINWNQRSNVSYTLNMDAMSDVDYDWIYELFLSPKLYAEIDGYFYPVTVKTSEFEFSKIINNRLKVFEIQVEIRQINSHAR